MDEKVLAAVRTEYWDGFWDECEDDATMSTDTLTQALSALPTAERIALADKLYASVPEDWQRAVDEAWLKEAERRCAEMDADPSMCLSYEEFMAGLEIHRRKA
jgi:putative addiction module component (TIGR02574 family)